MTLENCQRLLKHYNALADGTIEQPFGHKNWADVVHNAKVRAVAMEERIAHKETLPKYIAIRKAEEEDKKKKEEEEKAKSKSKEKKDGKTTKR